MTVTVTEAGPVLRRLGFEERIKGDHRWLEPDVFAHENKQPWNGRQRVYACGGVARFVREQHGLHAGRSESLLYKGDDFAHTDLVAAHSS